MSDRRLSQRDVQVARRRGTPREQTDDRKSLDIGVLNEHLGYFIRRLQVWVLDKLERRGLTQRLASPTDRRSHALRLTREGQKILKRAAMLAALHEAKLIEKLGSEQRKSMLTLLKHFDR
jgi:hypothetical protein